MRCLLGARIAAIACSLLCIGATAASADVVLDWNAIAIRTLTQPAPAQNPFFQARFLAITQLAVFEAVNSIDGNYESYLGTPAAPPGASADAAAIAAAHKVLVTYFPAAAALLDADRASSLAAIADGPAKTAGIAAGEAAALAMIANRANDGSAPVPPYVPSPALPGDWHLTPGCLSGALPQWPTLKPFGIPRATDFISAPPPSLSSHKYVKDYLEVKAVGDMASTQRPPDRADVARYYAAISPSQALNMVARQISAARGDSLSRNAWALALLNMSINDSLIVSFATKYHYNLWRPVTAIRLGDTDGNKKTDPDPAFTPFISTPCFPSYPSNHASGTNGGLGILIILYGAAHDLTLPHPTLPLTLSYTSLKQIGADVDDARVYGGIHFRFDQEAGNKLGRSVARYIYDNNLRKLSGSR